MKSVNFSSLTEIKKSVSDGKTLVANAITAKGVSTASDASFATMATNIAKISSKPILMGSISSKTTATINIKSKRPNDYQKFTTANFMYSATGVYHYQTGYSAGDVITGSNTIGITSYNASTGILTITTGYYRSSSAYSYTSGYVYLIP